MEKTEGPQAGEPDKPRQPGQPGQFDASEVDTLRTVDSVTEQIEHLLNAIEHLAAAQQALTPDFRAARDAARQRLFGQAGVSIFCTCLIVLMAFYVRQSTIETVTRNCAVQTALLQTLTGTRTLPTHMPAPAVAPAVTPAVAPTPVPGHPLNLCLPK